MREERDSLAGGGGERRRRGRAAPRRAAAAGRRLGSGRHLRRGQRKIFNVFGDLPKLGDHSGKHARFILIPPTRWGRFRR